MDKKSLLIIDDDKAILKSFKDLLEMKGYRVDTAENGRPMRDSITWH
jgi:DNA-binding NtrC family response regulator